MRFGQRGSAIGCEKNDPPEIPGKAERMVSREILTER
jgi:hypothetical protein